MSHLIVAGALLIFIGVVLFFAGQNAKDKLAFRGSGALIVTLGVWVLLTMVLPEL